MRKYPITRSKTRKMDRKILLLALLSVPAVLLVPGSIAPVHAANTFQPCDVFAAVGSGKIAWWRPNACGIPTSATFQGFLTASVSNTFMTGMAFNKPSCDLGAGNPCLYATMFDSQAVAVFDNTGAFLGTCGTGYNGNPESIVIDLASTPKVIFVGQAGGTHQILKFNLNCSTGTPASFSPATERVGTDWIDLAADLCTMLYTSEGFHVKSFNICTNTQNPDFAALPTGSAFALRIRPVGTGSGGNGSVLVADTSFDVHVSNVGGVINTCDSGSAGAGGLFSLNLLPGGNESVSGSFGNNQVDYMTVPNCDAGKTTPDFSFNAVAGTGCTGTCQLFGLSVFGEVTVSQPPPSADIDGDGIPDSVELSPAMQALGADPCRKTIPVQIDYMVASDHTHKPLQAAIDKVVASFDAAPVPATLPCPFAGFPKKPSGISLIVDVKNAIPEQTALNFTGTAPEIFDTIKAKFFDPARAPYFHYSLWVHDLAPGSTVSGIGELGGANFIVSQGEWTNHTGTVDEQAGTFMHELGHNIGLDHGGGDELNFKSNYLSVMNYASQTVGITSLLPNGTITTRFDYSRTTLPSLNEAALNETAGIKAGNDYTTWRCPATVGGNRTSLGSGPLDWNCNGTINSNSASVDLNGDGSLETLVGFNDWASLAYRFTNSTNFVHGGHITLPKGKELTFEQAKVIETYWKEFSSLKVSQFFTDSSLNPLPLDSNGNPKVDVVLANSVVRSTNPGQVLAWVNVTNTAGAPVKSLKLTETLPTDWVIHPTKITPGAIQVFYVFANGTRLDITNQTSIAVTTGNPETVLLSIANITATRAGTTLGTRQGILISAKLAYGLIGTTQSASSYPRKYTDTATITTFSRAFFDGTSVSATGSAFFIAYAKVLGDVNGDFKVDIVDAALLAYSYGAKQGDALWNPSSDFNYDGVIDIKDAAILAFYYGTSS